MSKSLSAVLTAMAMALLALIVFGFPLMASPAGLDFVSQAYLAAATLVFLGSLLSERRGAPDFMLSFFCLMFLALPARAQISAGVFPWAASLSIEDQIDTYALMAISQLSYLLARNLVERVFHPVAPEPLRDDASAALYFRKWAIGFALVAVVFAALVGPQRLFLPRFSDLEIKNTGITEQLLMMARSLMLLATVMIFFLARNAPDAWQRRRNLIAAGLMVPVFLIINYPPGLPRFLLIGGFLALSLVFLDFRRPMVKASVALFGIFFLFSVFPAIKILAHPDSTLSDVLASATNVNIESYILRVDFDGYMQIVSTVSYLKDGNPLRYGNNFLGVLLFFVPRAIWPGKPIDSGEIVSTTLGYWYTNVSNPLPAEALIGFGAIGPILVFGLLGVILARVDMRAKLGGNFQARAMSFFPMALWAGFMVIILRGALNGVAPMFGTGFLAYFVMSVVYRRRIRWR